jgi:hypothetical protein
MFAGGSFGETALRVLPEWQQISPATCHFGLANLPILAYDIRHAMIQVSTR